MFAFETGKIVGYIIGCLAIVGLAVWLIMRSLKKKKGQDQNDPGSEG